MSGRGDLNIDGIMTGVGGGEYRFVTINGHGTINGDVDCLTFSSNGRAVVRGAVEAAERVDVNGAATFEQKLAAGEVRINGKADIGGALHAELLRVDGHMKVGEGLSGESVEVNGYLGVHGSCEAELFRSRGCFRIGGLLNAGKIEVELYVECRAKEIGCETVEVRRPLSANPFGKLVRTLFSGDMLIAGTIEGDDIYLESTKAEIVRGKRVKLGAGCEIGLVEYSESYEQSPEARVRDSRKSV
ncbi:protein CcmA, bactofilin family [Paenibacillus sp. UNCCL117]|uniref:polymer-forming cytoskeletal protein n=1 Tax=unclassified Paenibacillus TaxID=185978 RepID=UPI0008852AF7|nr:MULTISPECIES: polymer-forming cytoskeletal protein [unclassified Paenibacillus]SDD00610.1 protein CcmA, bactofilin family [Paenibacillus sp. cl123]SFW32833.1 protein CcmA, bactofilin family [Paenibacillus sp. UNCCL117]